jgi:hypothetical protein
MVNKYKKDLICEDCSCDITLNEYAIYDEKCEWCYSIYLGHKVFECCKCAKKTLNEEDMMFNVGLNYYCHSCGKDEESEEESDLEDEESELEIDLDETEFW